MEKLNIAAILQDKPQNTRLWSPIFGDVYLKDVTDVNNNMIRITHHGVDNIFMNNGKVWADGDVCLFPSKQMQDWSKFAWKKGDVLESDNKLKRCIFKEWANDDYTEFNCFAMDEGWNDYFSKINNSTSKYHKADDYVTELHIKRVEKKFGGKLNLETLEIEQPKQEFKDGDIVVAEEDNYYDKVIFIATIKDDIVSKALINVRYEDYKVYYNEYRFGHNRSLRLATYSEKQQLFSALAKKGKRWNPDTKQIEDLPKKYEFKPFQKVLAKFDEDCEWMPDFFYHYDKSDSEMPYVCIANGRAIECIPYNEETKHLLGTTDEWKG
nr:MAG TPA: hypothetical protein [Crassvirales sp.]